MAAKHRNAAGIGASGGASKSVLRDGGQSEGSPARPGNQRFTEDLTPAELRQVRELWWRQWSLRHRLPAERGVVLINGGAS